MQKMSVFRYQFLITYIFSVSVNFEAFYISGTSLRQRILLKVYRYLLAFFCCFSSKICVFVILVSLVDEVTNFHNRIWTNHKSELTIKKCQWDCMKNNIRSSSFLNNDCYRSVCQKRQLQHVPSFIITSYSVADV